MPITNLHQILASVIINCRVAKVEDVNTIIVLEGAQLQKGLALSSGD